MADLHIVRKHALGLAAARKIAFKWAEQVENDLGMSCTYEEGRSADTVGFSRSGVQGQLQVTKDCFELDAKLGFLIGAFKTRIEAEIIQMLNQLVPEPAAAALTPAPRKTAARKASAKK
ncbi:MAG: polyhydroxyalkanoic acid system family protein [Burkholderiaceae bacterium]